jgi:hypothetical protein
MSAEMADLRSAGRWLGGPRTLLQALGLHHDELRLTAGLAWLLDPEGHHRLGDRVLRGFLQRLDVQVPRLHPVRIAREEARNVTRADLIVRLPGATVLVEAKVWAGEQLTQCTRLAQEWADESPVLVFLTRTGKPPETAGPDSSWQCLRWADVIEIVDRALRDSHPDHTSSAGVIDYLTTLREFHGERRT